MKKNSHTLLPEPDEWSFFCRLLLKDIPYGENKLRRLAFDIERKPLRGIFVAVRLLGICY